MFGRRLAPRPRPLLDSGSTQQISEVNGGNLLISDDLGWSRPGPWRFVCGLTSRAKKYNQAKTQAHAAQLIRGGVLGEWKVCLLCVFAVPWWPRGHQEVNFEQERNAMVLLCLFYEIRFARQRLPRPGKKSGDGVRPSVAPRRRLESIPLSHRRGIDVEGTGGGGPAAGAAAAALKAAELSSSGNRLPKTIVRRLWS